MGGRSLGRLETRTMTSLTSTSATSRTGTTGIQGTSPRQSLANTGLDGSDHDAYDNPLYLTRSDNEPPSLDDMPLRNKPTETGKVRKAINEHSSSLGDR